MRATNKQKMENMTIHLKTQGYCCQVCWVTLPVCNHEVMLRATVLAIMVVMVMLMVVVFAIEKMVDNPPVKLIETISKPSRSISQARPQPRKAQLCLRNI